MRLFATATLALSTIAFGQPGSPPVQAKRLPPEKTNVGEKARDRALLDQYDYGAQVVALQGEAPLPTPGVAPSRPDAPPPASTVPIDFKPKVDVQLTPTAQDAVQVSEKWQSEHNQVATGRDGRVVYSYGAGLPTVVCAPLRVCIVELQAGEKLVGEPHIGDSIRWYLSPASYGNGDSLTPIIVLKPQTPGLDTNLLITTDRRAYYLRLLSKPEDYVARVAFAYPGEEENVRQWREHLAQQKEQQRQASRIAELPANALDVMNFAYRLKGGDGSTRPIRVFDDGKKTYIQMNPSVRNAEAPVLVIVGPDGKPEMVNYRVKDDLYIVDRLFDRAALILGSGKKARKVEVIRERKT